MKVLVTGAAGFIGSHLAERLVRDGHRVLAFDNFSTGYRRNFERIDDDIEVVEGDLRNEEDVLRAVEGVELVYHQAGLVSMPFSVADPKTTFAVNVTGTLNLLVAARDAGVRRLVFASSCAIYGDSPVSPKHEDLPPHPLSPYAVSKLTAEQLCTVFNDLYDLETVSLRYFNVFGPHQDPDSAYAAAIPKFLRALADGERLVVFGDGEQSRGFTYVDDVVEGNILAGAAPQAAGAVMNLASDQSVSVNATLAMIGALLDRDIEPEYQPPRPGDIRESRADISRARELLEFEPQVPFEEGLARTIKAFPSSYPGAHAW